MTREDREAEIADYVGYLVAEKIGRGKPLRELARMQGPELRAAIDTALQEMEREASSNRQ